MADGIPTGFIQEIRLCSKSRKKEGVREKAF
jgi:hypothetical protein